MKSLLQAANAKPDIRVILTSAYSQEMIAGAMRPAADPQLYSQAVSIRGALEDASEFFGFVVKCLLPQR